MRFFRNCLEEEMTIREELIEHPVREKRTAEVSGVRKAVRPFNETRVISE
jgi:hypothetical protein